MGEAMDKSWMVKEAHFFAGDEWDNWQAGDPSIKIYCNSSDEFDIRLRINEGDDGMKEYSLDELPMQMAREMRDFLIYMVPEEDEA